MERKLLNMAVGLAILFLMIPGLLAQEQKPREVTLNLDEAIYQALKTTST